METKEEIEKRTEEMKDMSNYENGGEINGKETK